MHTIPAEFIIANYFEDATRGNELTLSTLAEIKIKIEGEKEFRDIFLFVDLSGDSIAGAVNSNPKYFLFNESRTAIQFKSSQREIFYEDLYTIFNARIDRSVRYKLLVSLDKIFLAMSDVYS